MNMKSKGLPEITEVKELAEYLRVSKRHIYDMLNIKDAPKYRLGRRILIPTREFFTWLKEQSA